MRSAEFRVWNGKLQFLSARKAERSDRASASEKGSPEGLPFGAGPGRRESWSVKKMAGAGLPSPAKKRGRAKRAKFLGQGSSHRQADCFAAQPRKLSGGDCPSAQILSLEKSGLDLDATRGRVSEDKASAETERKASGFKGVSAGRDVVHKIGLVEGQNFSRSGEVVLLWPN
jgi:hypothetical protein